MAKGGRYLKKAAPKKKRKVLPIILIIILVLLVGGIGAGVWYYNHLLSMITRPDDVVMQPTETQALEVTEAVETEPTEPPTTSPEDTWPVIVSDENITNIMLIGQAAREGETSLIADTMILCSINRETKTLTMTSLMRDLRLVWPAYVDINGKTRTGNNRINMAYNMGYRWAGNNVKGGMDVMAGIVEYNFGVPVDYSVEVNFQVFMDVVDYLGGATVDISQEEYDYMLKNCNWMEEEGVHVGENTLGGYHALGYARMRKVGNGDFERTERQREVITSLLNNLKEMGIMKVHGLFTTLMPNITTDMTNSEITNLAFELIPMLKDLKIQSQRIPFDGTYSTQQFIIEGQPTPDYQMVCDVKENGRLLREAIGMPHPVEPVE